MFNNNDDSEDKHALNEQARPKRSWPSGETGPIFRKLRRRDSRPEVTPSITAAYDDDAYCNLSVYDRPGKSVNETAPSTFL